MLKQAKTAGKGKMQVVSKDHEIGLIRVSATVEGKTEEFTFTKLPQANPASGAATFRCRNVSTSGKQYTVQLGEGRGCASAKGAGSVASNASTFGWRRRCCSKANSRICSVVSIYTAGDVRRQCGSEVPRHARARPFHRLESRN